MPAASLTGTWRSVVVLVEPDPGSALDEGLTRAMVEDVLELVGAMAGVQVALCCPPAYDDPQALVWPGTPVLDPGELSRLLERAGGQLCLVAADAPDLPVLLLATLFSALEGAPAAVAPADGGGLVAVAVRLPWMRPLALADAPPGAVVSSGWRRVRAPADLERLDPGLEGWEATRAHLTGRPPPPSAGR